MNKLISLGFLALTTVACSSSGGGSGQTQDAERVILDIPCVTDADCPSGFECESEVEHAATKTFCASHQSDDGGSTSDDGPGHDATDDKGAGGNDDGTSHDATDDDGAGGADDGTTDDNGAGGRGHHGSDG